VDHGGTMPMAGIGNCSDYCRAVALGHPDSWDDVRMSIRRPTVAVAVHDGYYGCGTGAGYANDAFLRILVELLPRRVRLVLLPVYLRPDSAERHTPWYHSTLDLVRRVGAAMYPVHNDTDGQDRFGTLRNFRHLVADTATVLREKVLDTAEPLLIIAFDAPFLGLSAVLPTAVRPDVVLVPRSSARIHTPTDTDRITWEANGLRAGHGTRVGVISHYMRHHLHDDYGVPEAALIDLPDGLAAADWSRTPPPDTALPAAARPGFLFAMGRAEPYKGFEDLLDAVAHLRRTGRRVPHLVLAATVEGPHPTVYQRRLADHIARLDLDATLLTRFEPGVRRLLAHPALRAVVVPSRVEPFGRVPIEAFAAGATPVISTTAGGLAEQVTDGHTGFVAPPHDPIRLAAAIGRGLDLAPAERDRMRRAAAVVAARDYDHRRAVEDFLASAAPWLSDYR
jgi:glycosyltransferase involved in cell wall biosynthesis